MHLSSHHSGMEKKSYYTFKWARLLMCIVLMWPSVHTANSWLSEVREHCARRCYSDAHIILTSAEPRPPQQTIYQELIKRGSLFSFYFSFLPSGRDANEQWTGKKICQRVNQFWIKSWLSCIISPSSWKETVSMQMASIQRGTLAMLFSRDRDWVNVVL